MINKDEAKIMAILAIAKLFGEEYVRGHINKTCETYPDNDDMVNRETKEVIFLDYKTPDGEKMKNPSSPISFAQ